MVSRSIRLAAPVLLCLLPAAALAADPTYPFQNPKLPAEQRVADLLGRLTLEEKVGLLSGGGEFTSRAIDRLGVPALRFSDGPNGVRSNEGIPATVFPAGVAAAATWNPARI